MIPLVRSYDISRLGHSLILRRSISSVYAFILFPDFDGFHDAHLLPSFLTTRRSNSSPFQLRFSICYFRIPERVRARESSVPRTAMTTTLLVVAILPLHLGRFQSSFSFTSFDYWEPSSVGGPEHHEEQEPRDLLIHSSCSRKFGLLKYSGTGSSSLEITL